MHLIYRLVVQPNKSKAHLFAEAFIEGGGLETLLVLLQREAKIGDQSIVESPTENMDSLSADRIESDCENEIPGESEDGKVGLTQERTSPIMKDIPSAVSTRSKFGRNLSISETSFLKNLGGITLSISAENARNNVYNIDKSDGIVVAIIGLLGALVSMGLLKSGSSPPDHTSSLTRSSVNDGGATMSDDKVSLVFFALQKAIEAAPNRLMSNNVYTALLGGSVWIFPSFRVDHLRFPRITFTFIFFLCSSR